jgi:tetratricopeptide (TPR) repeat protein
VKRHALLAFAMLVATALHGTADAKINKPHMLGNWLVATITDDASGQFTECSALTDYKNGFVLAFLLTRDLTWAIGFQNNRWQFAPQTQLDIKYKIDNGEIREAKGIAVARDTVRIVLPTDEALFEEFRKGQMLAITAGQGGSQFSLKTTSRMLAELMKCAKDNGGTATARSLDMTPKPDAPAAAMLTVPPPAQQAAVAAPAPAAPAATLIKPTERRVALVIGNSAYRYAPKLENPKNDAADLSNALRTLGFEVIEGKDLDRKGMEDSISQFTDKIKTAKLAAFFYAGHGLQIDSENYLVPIDGRIERVADLNTNAVSLRYVLAQLEKDKRVNLLFLDACRDNPLLNSINLSLETRTATSGKGLAQMKAAIDTLVVYATQPDNVALDGSGRNSPFTTALLKHMQTPNIEISGLMKRVRSDVAAATKEAQVPWDHSSLRTDVVLAKTAGPAPVAVSSLADSLSRDNVTVFNESEAIAAECDRAAADPFDVNKPASVRGVHRNVISRDALQLCAKAVVNDEKNPRMNYQLGRALYAAGDYAKARVLFQAAATTGYPQAITELGRMSFFGHGTAQSYTTAREQFEKAAALGDPSAIKNIGFMYHMGRGVKANIQQAIAYYKKAPDHPTVMNNMAVLYEKGIGVPADLPKAVRMYEQAVLGGDESAMSNLAELYERGAGVPKDLEKARTLYRMAATLGDQVGKQAVARLR